MIALIQRVTEASVRVEGVTRARIAHGLLTFVAVERSDAEGNVLRMLDRLLGYRVFADEQGKMNLSLRDVGGGLLLVPQFTLTADTTKGMRPSFSSAAPAELAARLFEYLAGEARKAWPLLATGVFGADMAVSLVNDGPVTFWLVT